MAEPLLSIRGLQVRYGRPPGGVTAVHALDLDIQPGERLGLVGESGSGKSTAALAALRLLPPPALITAGSVRFCGEEVLAWDESRLRRWWWRDVSLVPQSALNALNPVLSIGTHFFETFVAHGIVDRAEIGRRSQTLMRLVDLDPIHLDSYAHSLSGGMRQRVALALALALDPRLIVMDEPTTALDVVVEREILQRILALQAERGFAILFITHDLGLLLELAHRVGVLYSGHLVEDAPVEHFIAGGRHPYSRGLLTAMPTLGGARTAQGIPGAPPRLDEPPSGCPFHPRCARRLPTCHIHLPSLTPYEGVQGNQSPVPSRVACPNPHELLRAP